MIAVRVKFIDLVYIHKLGGVVRDNTTGFGIIWSRWGMMTLQDFFEKSWNTFLVGGLVISQIFPEHFF